jgi:cob(I)alamin adenosyltransferase
MYLSDMKIYTKQGDKGKTQLLGGKVVDKFDVKIEAYGNIDELNSFIGHLHDQNIDENHKKFLTFIQIQLLNLGSIISFDGTKKNLELPQVLISDVKKIENEIDKLEKDLTPISSFILPSGHPISSLCHIVRSVCRRAERGVVLLSSKEESQEIAIQFLNRLSDYLFVLSRKILQENNISETYWK